MSKVIWSLHYNGKAIYTNTDKPACPAAIILRYWPDIDQERLPQLPDQPIENGETGQKLEWVSYQA